MNNKYPFFKYVPGDSIIHLLNSKMKIIWFILTFLNIALINDYLSLLILSVFLLILILISKIDILAYLSNTLILWPLSIIILIVVFGITFDMPLAILNMVKVFLLVTLMLVLTFTTSLSQIAWGFECTFIKLKKMKVPVSKISLRIAMDIKFISTLFEKSKEIRKSMAYRGVTYYKNALDSFRRMIIPVISVSYKLSRRMVKSMKLRFYGNLERRTNYHENKVTILDKILVCISIILIYVVILLGWC